MRALPLILALGAAAVPGGGPPKPALLPEAVARGHATAQRICARCHAVEATGEAPDRRAPTFRALSGQFTPLTLQRRLTEIAETGHYDMPPVSVDSDEVADLAAYINSLGAPRDDRPERGR
jgi:cytochrome c